jgi:tetratricopeptide (TPR) repeat protein
MTATKPTAWAAGSRYLCVSRKLGQFDKALADYDVALTKNPKNADWLYGRGVTKLRKGDTTDGNADIAGAKIIKADVAEEYARYGIK